MKYADMKLKEEEQRATRYLETRKGCNSVTCVCIAIIYTWRSESHENKKPLIPELLNSNLQVLLLICSHDCYVRVDGFLKGGK